MTKRYPAQIAFVENPRGGSWNGHLVNPNVLDTERDLPHRGGFICRIVADDPENPLASCEMLRQAYSPHGRTRTVHASVSDAQAVAIKWVARRFKVEA